MSLTPLTISYQPAMYWALPIYLADRLKYFEELGLDPSFVAHPSGGPQVAAAAESKAAWDIGGAGVVPNILGWTKSIETIYNARVTVPSDLRRFVDPQHSTFKKNLRISADTRSRGLLAGSFTWAETGHGT